MKTKIKLVFVAVCTFCTLSFAQDKVVDTVKHDYQLILGYSLSSNLKDYMTNDLNYSVTHLFSKIRPSGLFTKIGFDMNVQGFNTTKSIDFNRDSLWTTAYSFPHPSGAFKNGILNFQFGIPMSFGYTFLARDKKDRVELNLGVTTYYTLSYHTESYDVEDQGTKFSHEPTTNLYFIQNPINFTGNASFNYIVKNSWFLGLNTSYALNSMYNTKYMKFNPFSIGVSIGLNIRSKNKK